MAGIGPMELIVVLVIALVILGPKRLPDAGRSVGRGIREFKSAMTGANHDDEDVPALAPPSEASGPTGRPAQDTRSDAPSRAASPMAP